MLEFYRNKNVFVTGHTGFKGSWLCKVLGMAGANITGFALEPTEESLFKIADISKDVKSVFGDIRNFEELKSAFDEARPEIVIHLAAQPIVRESYKKPRYTYETNVMGSVNLLECVRLSNWVKSFLNVTTDKVYENREWNCVYKEGDPLNGFDPYSNSKSCSELVTSSYKNSFFNNKDIAISTARAGNVIGGGDFAIDRILPDCIRAAQSHGTIVIRNPYSIRPYQHVLEPIMAYLEIIEKQYENNQFADSYNVAPDDSDCAQTSSLVDLFIKHWQEDLKCEKLSNRDSREAHFLKLDCSKLKRALGWRPRWNLNKAVEKVVEWTKCYFAQKDIRACMDNQIMEYLSEVK